MPYYPKQPEATAWWDPDEVRAREDEVLRPGKYPPMPWFFAALLEAFRQPGSVYADAEKRRLRVPRDRPNKPTRSCKACESGRCPMSPRFDLRGQYAGGRFFELVDATPYKKVWRCSRCGETFRLMSSDNPANYHSC